jgi:hypothetical protein
MFNHEIFAVAFGRTVELLRTGAPVAQQKSALRAVYALTSVASAMLRVYQDMLTVDDVGIPDTLDFVPDLIRRMTEHGVAEIAIARDATPAELLALVRGLAAEPDAEGGARPIKRRLREARSLRIMVIPAHPDEGELGAARVTEAFELEAMELEREPTADHVAEPTIAPAPEALDDFYEPSRMIELPEVPVVKTPVRPSLVAAPPAAAPSLPPPPPPPAEAQPPAEPPAAAERSTTVVSGGSPINAALAKVAADPFGSQVLERLTALEREIQRALANNEIEPAVHALSAIVSWEPQAPPGSARNAYAISMQRTLTVGVLTQLAGYIGDRWLGAEIMKIMQRGRIDAVEVLLGLLTTSESIRERKQYMNVLRTIPEGFSQVVHMLTDGRWFVVRNVAELMGEHRIAEAVPELAKCLGHADARVRRAAAIALAKIGTPATVEPLRRVLKEGDSEMRALVAGSIAGPGSRGLAMPLVGLAEHEEDLDVLKEYYLALGRIGSPEAVQALVLAAQPGRRLLKRKPTEPRAAAVEGLRLAGGATALAALEELVDDADRTIREGARAARDDIRARASGASS